jgi:hypothetical protein
MSSAIVRACIVLHGSGPLCSRASQRVAGATPSVPSSVAPPGPAQATAWEVLPIPTVAATALPAVGMGASRRVAPAGSADGKPSAGRREGSAYRWAAMGAKGAPREAPAEAHRRRRRCLPAPTDFRRTMPPALTAVPRRERIAAGPSPVSTPGRFVLAPSSLASGPASHRTPNASIRAIARRATAIRASTSAPSASRAAIAYRLACRIAERTAFAWSV